VDEEMKTLKLRVRRKPVNRGYERSGCGRRLHRVQDVKEREAAPFALPTEDDQGLAKSRRN
jgi:hypothetical protein